MRAMTARREAGLPSPFQGTRPGRGQVEALRDELGLTAAEARVALALADGLGVDEICTSLGVAPPTVRSHLKATYRKTGARGQVQLVVLVFRLLRAGPTRARPTGREND